MRCAVRLQSPCRATAGFDRAMRPVGDGEVRQVELVRAPAGRRRVGCLVRRGQAGPEDRQLVAVGLCVRAAQRAGHVPPLRLVARVRAVVLRKRERRGAVARR